MDGASDDPGAPPDSWEMADLDASMSRLLVSSKKGSPPSSLSSAFSSPPELADEAPPSASEGLAGRGASEDLISKVDQFLREALEKPRERLAILRMEQDVEKFIRDPTQQQLEFQALPTSYLRLAAHRVAQHYYLQSVAIPDNSFPDGSGSRILLRKTSLECRLPPIRLADIPVNMPQDESNVTFKVAIKQRPQKRSQFVSTANNHSSKNSQKSVEERKEEYNRARARIFNNNNSSSLSAKSDDELNLPDSLHDCSFVSSQPDEKPFTEQLDNYTRRVSGESASGSSRSSKTKSEKDPIIFRPRTNSRVAIFRDREVDRKDPDYDRSYDRYMQRFDPGFGFNASTYNVQALYAPAANYNTEFPQLGSGPRSQIPIDHPPRSIHQHVRGPWSTASPPALVNYGPPEGLMTPFGPNHVGAHSNSSVYLHSSQYPVPQRPGVTFVRPHNIQSFAQAHQQQPEASFGLARPR